MPLVLRSRRIFLGGYLTFFGGGRAGDSHREAQNKHWPIRSFGGWKSPIGVQGHSPGRVSGGRSPSEAEDFCTFDIKKSIT